MLAVLFRKKLVCHNDKVLFVFFFVFLNGISQPSVQRAFMKSNHLQMTSILQPESLPSVYTRDGKGKREQLVFQALETGCSSVIRTGITLPDDSNGSRGQLHSSPQGGETDYCTLLENSNYS